ncbi:hypothetical protein KKH36_03045 [Patescibacteria group bacterium]|nr:hypothetical protein [Patescibacteria group bacterium]
MELTGNIAKDNRKKKWLKKKSHKVKDPYNTDSLWNNFFDGCVAFWQTMGNKEFAVDLNNEYTGVARCTQRS